MSRTPLASATQSVGCVATTLQLTSSHCHYASRDCVLSSSCEHVCGMRIWYTARWRSLHAGRGRGGNITADSTPAHCLGQGQIVVLLPSSASLMFESPVFEVYRHNQPHAVRPQYLIHISVQSVHMCSGLNINACMHADRLFRHPRHAKR
jgi:hypothetical protein